MASGIRIAYDNDWIQTHYFDYPTVNEMCDAYNREHRTEIKQGTFKSHCNREMSMSGFRQERINYNRAQTEWLKANYPKLGQVETAKRFNERFGTRRSVGGIKTYCQKIGLRVDSEVSAMHHYENANSCGREHELGDVWMAKDGFLHTKVSNEPYIGQSKACPRLHRHVYEKHYGSIPKGYKVIFLDGDKTNCNIENLCCVPSSYLALMNKLNLKSEFPEITKTSVRWCDLYLALKQKGYLKKEA